MKICKVKSLLISDNGSSLRLRVINHIWEGNENIVEKQDISRAAKTVRLLMRERRYKEVVKMAQDLRLDRINNGLLILDIVEAYEHLGEKRAAKDTLLSYYDIHGITGRNMMQKLIELCIETGDIGHAVDLCLQYENEWPESSISYLMRYQITTSAKGSLEERIYYLEKYKETDFEERWAYELAKLYHKNYQNQECAAVCHELICLFGHGKYVEKAVQLKEKTIGLSEDEIAILDAVKRRAEEARRAREEAERQARKEAERQAREEAERQARKEAERQAREEAERQAREEAERQAREEAECQAREKTDYQVGEGAGYRAREENDYRVGYEAKYQAYAENDTKDREGGWNAETATQKMMQEKLYQTEEAARLRKQKQEEEKKSREDKIAQALKTTDRYAQVEKNKEDRIIFEQLPSDVEEKIEKQKTEYAPNQNNKGIFSAFGRMASDFKKTLQPEEDFAEVEEGAEEIEYITLGRDSQAYAEDVEERMLSELDMLDDDELDSLTSAQIKGLYELKVLRDVREEIQTLLQTTDSAYQSGQLADELEKFVKSDPYPNPVYQDEEVEPNLEEKETVESSEAESVEETEIKAEAGTAEQMEMETAEPIEAEFTKGKAGAFKQVETESVEKNEIQVKAEAETAESVETESAEAIEMPVEEEAETAETVEAESVEATEMPVEEEAETAESVEVELVEEAKMPVEEEVKTAETVEAESVEATEMPVEEEAETAETVEAESVEATEMPVEEEAETVEAVEAESVEESEIYVEKEAETVETETEVKMEAMQSMEATDANTATETGEDDVLKQNEEENETDAVTLEETVEANQTSANGERNAESESASEVDVETVIVQKEATILDRIQNPDENLSQTEFRECLIAWAKEQGYQVDEMAYMTIAVLAEEMQTKNVPLSLNHAKKMADDAIEKAQKRNPFDKIMDRYNKKHAYLLKDKHFDWHMD